MAQVRNTSSRRPSRRESRYGVKALIAAGAVAATAAGWAALVAGASGQVASAEDASSQVASAVILPASATASTSASTGATTSAATSLAQLPRVSAPIALAVTRSSR